MSGGGSGGTTQSQNNIAPEVAPLFAQTGQLVQGIQSDMPGFGQFFGSNPQQVPGQTAGQQDIGAILRQQVMGNALNAPQQDAYSSLSSLINSPVGSSPATIAAMQAARTPIVNDLANAGLGNSGAVGTGLGGAYAPILAQEMQQRFAAIPMLNQLGGTQYAQTQGNLQSYGASEEQARSNEALQGQANYQDFLRQQGLGSSFTTGILSGFPTIGSTSGITKQSGGGMSKICGELRRQGIMDVRTYFADQEFGEKLPAHIIAGYHFWSTSVVRWMKQSDRFTKIVAPIGLGWAQEMRHRIYEDVPGTIVGKLLLWIGVPVCAAIGSFVGIPQRPCSLFSRRANSSLL